MRYKSFRVQNFKGIRDTTISLDACAGASVFALVGLNESGKTTILEAIHSFSPDDATSVLVGASGTARAYAKNVPRHLISTFTGRISVEATILLTAEDKESIASQLKASENIELNVESLADEIKIERFQTFQSGDFVSAHLELNSPISVRSAGKRKWLTPSKDERHKVKMAIYNRTPDIAYFPTFIFEFPDKVFLTDRGGRTDKFYRTVFQDILDYDGRGHTIQQDIVRRVRSDDNIVPWLSFFSAWLQHEDKNKIQHVMDRASAAVTKLVFGRWNKIFGEDASDREVLISFEVVEGEVVDAKNVVTKTQAHDVYIRFQVKDGTRRFNVDDRSLGFRWFFAFMLFTQFRVARNTSRPLLFLFDEPASNLHAAAQQKLIESFPEIGKGDHTLVYTTHSHYMIEPKWLEQTLIVTNRADAPEVASTLDASLDDESLDIAASTYRSFVNKHPQQVNYFQPILDRLEVVPSRFDLTRASIIMEGKSDYFIVRYAVALLGENDIPIMPGLGAGTFGALAALHVGWNLNFLFVLDGDKQGAIEKQRYVEDFGVPETRLVLLSDLVPSLSLIEDLLDVEAKSHVQQLLQLSEPPTKAQIRRFFQERLASGEVVPLGAEFSTRSSQLVAALNERLLPLVA